MDDNETEKKKLVDTEVPDDAVKMETSDSPSFCTLSVLESPTKWLICTFRVRLIGVLALLLLQIPILVYYSSPSTQYFKVTHSYGGELWDNISGKSGRNSSENLGNFTTPEILNLSTVTRNYSYVNVFATVSFSTPKVKSSSANSTTKITTIKATTTTVAPSTESTTTTTTTVTTTTTRKTEPVTAAAGSILPICPPEPPGLQGRLEISFNKPPNTFEQTKLDNPLLTKGGHAKPPLCVARYKVAIIIPYRDRVEHLRYFVQFMHPKLQRQEIDYQIFIINQLGYGKFNRAKLMNIGFLEALKLYPFDCFSFHDVDLIVEDDRSLYWCSDRPRHMSAGVDKFNYILPYENIFGGVTLFSKEQMEKINGFSNEFWGWGGEDDDVFNRLKIVGYRIIRYPMEIARYKMIRHQSEAGNEPNPKRFQMIKETSSHFRQDGLNSIKYKVNSIEFQPTYTNITVDVLESK